MPLVITVIASVVAPLLHENVAPGTPVAVSRELPQLLVTDTEGAAGIGSTINVAALEVAVPAMLVHTARYCLLLSAAVVAKAKVPVAAPVMLVQLVPLVLSCHCTVGAGLPLAAELKLTFKPAHFVCDAGCVVTAGDTMLPSTPTVTTTFCVLVHPLAVNVYT